MSDLVNSGYYDRWKTSPPEPDHKSRCGKCACGCDEYIYAGDDIYLLDDDRMVREECWPDFLEMEFGVTKTIAEVEEPDYDDRGD